jgi:hypothetical protein
MVKTRRGRSRYRQWVAVATFVGLTGALGTLQPALALSFSLDTTALSGTSARLEFTLFDGDFTDNNSVTISGLATDGTFQATDCTVSCVGGPPFVISDTGGFGEFLQDLTLGNTVSFDLALTASFAGVPGAVSDRFVLSLLDPGTNFTLVDTDLDLLSDAIPFQDALLVIDLVGPVVQVAGTTNPKIHVTAVVPEPSTMLLLTLGISLILCRRTRRRYRS